MARAQGRWNAQRSRSRLAFHAGRRSSHVGTSRQDPWTLAFPTTGRARSGSLPSALPGMLRAQPLCVCLAAALRRPCPSGLSPASFCGGAVGYARPRNGGSDLAVALWLGHLFAVVKRTGGRCRRCAWGRSARRRRMVGLLPCFQTAALRGNVLSGEARKPGLASSGRVVHPGPARLLPFQRFALWL